MQTQLRKNIDAAHTYTNTAKGRENREERKDPTLTVEHSTTAMWSIWLFFSAFDRAREILSQP